MEGKKLGIYVLIILAVIIVIFLPGYSDFQRLKEENEQHQQRIKLLEEHNDMLKGELRKLSQDPLYLEKKAREKLGIVKKGEIIYKSSSEAKQ